MKYLPNVPTEQDKIKFMKEIKEKGIFEDKDITIEKVDYINLPPIINYQYISDMYFFSLFNHHNYYKGVDNQ